MLSSTESRPESVPDQQIVSGRDAEVAEALSALAMSKEARELAEAADAGVAETTG
jgi:hypothetical protein